MKWYYRKCNLKLWQLKIQVPTFEHAKWNFSIVWRQALNVRHVFEHESPNYRRWILGLRIPWMQPINHEIISVLVSILGMTIPNLLFRKQFFRSTSDFLYVIWKEFKCIECFFSLSILNACFNVKVTRRQCSKIEFSKMIYSYTI